VAREPSESGERQSPSPHPKQAAAFAPGRVNLIGEHTDYNQGLALPFAIAEGVIVHATAAAPGSPAGERIVAYARDLREQDEFPLARPTPAPGWRAFVRGVTAELARAGHPLVGGQLEISGDVPQGAGLSSSAALEVALCLALLALPDAAARAGVGVGVGLGASRVGAGASARSGGDERASVADCNRLHLARLCSRVESEWVGARTGLLDQIASLYGAPDTALRIDFRTLEITPVPLRMATGWRLVTLDSGESHANASSAYNERREECSAACHLLGIESLRDVHTGDLSRLPETLRRRARHVLEENIRVDETVAALRAGDLPAVGALLSASHASLRDRFEVSTPAVEAAVTELLAAGAAGARLVGGGFGGHVLGLLPPRAHAPAGARRVRLGPGAHLLES
jgi:galactokinase